MGGEVLPIGHAVAWTKEKARIAPGLSIEQLWRRALLGGGVFLGFLDDFLAGRLIDDLHGEADLAALV